MKLFQRSRVSSSCVHAKRASQVGVNRRPGTLDRILGPGFRAREMRLGFFAHVIPPAVGAVRLYEEVAATQMMDTLRVLHLVVSAFIALWVFNLSSQTRRVIVATSRCWHSQPLRAEALNVSASS